jgi:tRNA nucleotidyltransferase (CCA-adding enzyme)
MELITSHANADFDALAAMAAAKKLYPYAELAFGGSAEAGVREFLSLHGEWLQVKPAKEIELKKIKRLILVDTREAHRLGDFRELVEKPDLEIHVYDHHPPSYRDIVGDFNFIKPVGSTTTILVELLQEKKIPITTHEATLFCTGIYVDTGSLSFPTTTPNDARAVAWLLEQGASLRIVGDYLNRTLSQEQSQLLSKLILSAKHLEIHGHTILLAQASLDHYVEDLAVLTHRLIDLERVSAVFSVVKMGDRIFVVGRSSTPAIDVAEITAELGGGGHPTAASASLKKEGVELVTEKLLKILQRKVRPTLMAQDVMSMPAWSIPPNKTVAEAHQEMLRYGAKSFLVAEDGIIHGVISRRDIDKALHHGYGHAPVTAYMSRHIVTATPTTTLPDVQKLMVSYDIGRIPILDEGKVVGIVTRDDLLKGMALHDFQKPVLASTLQFEDWNILPSHILDLLKTAGELASLKKINLFAVGGFVRDLLLGVPNLDLDLVVEGDGIAFAKALQEKIEGRVISHEKFGTSVLILPDGQRIDIATARAEYYARPAALPEVVGTSIKQDLYRRDFTINAMALKLNPSEFGKLIDFFGGQRDLQHGIVRVLHNLSFVDDPTRIFRAIRFEQRYGFRIESHTEKLLRDAVRSNLVQRLSIERLRGEIILLLSEANPVPAIQRMSRLHVLPLLHPKLTLSSKTIQAMERIPSFLKNIDFSAENVEPWMIYWMTLFSEMESQDIQDILERFKFPKAQKEKLSFLLENWRKIAYNLSSQGEIQPSKIFNCLQKASPEALLFLLAIHPSLILEKRVKEYWQNLRKVKPLLSGEELLKLGIPFGPQVGEILKKIREKQLDGIIKTKEEAENFARNEADLT